MSLMPGIRAAKHPSMYYSYCNDVYANGARGISDHLELLAALNVAQHKVLLVTCRRSI